MGCYLRDDIRLYFLYHNSAAGYYRVCSCYIVIAKTAALANTALVMARFTASPSELNSPELSTDLAFLSDFNMYTLITNGTELTMRCHGKASKIISITAGVYRFYIEYPCNLVAPKWTIYSSFVRTHIVSLKSSFAYKLPRQTFLDSVTNLTLNPADYQLPLLRDVDRQQISLGQLVPVTYSTKSIYNRWWWSVFGVLLIIVLFAVVYMLGAGLDHIDQQLQNIRNLLRHSIILNLICAYLIILDHLRSLV